MNAPPSSGISGPRSPAGSGSPAAFLKELITDAALRMQASSGGTSVCGPAKGGTSARSLKHDEGRWAALREVQRGVGAGEVAAVAERVQAAWTRDLARRSRSSGADWIAYRSGGVEALEEFTHGLTASDGRRGSGVDEDQ